VFEIFIAKTLTNPSKGSQSVISIWVGQELVSLRHGGCSSTASCDNSIVDWLGQQNTHHNKESIQEEMYSHLDVEGHENWKEMILRRTIHYLVDWFPDMKDYLIEKKETKLCSFEWNRHLMSWQDERHSLKTRLERRSYLNWTKSKEEPLSWK
jgi:hypothetical protein